MNGSEVAAFNAISDSQLLILTTGTLETEQSPILVLQPVTRSSFPVIGIQGQIGSPLNGYVTPE